MSRGRAGPAEFLAGYDGILQTDAYAGYDSGVETVGVNVWD